MKYLQENDGIDHINIYSRGKTELGRMLSNFYEFNLIVSDGQFKSIEGYWYWLLAGKQKDREILRTLSGYNAKSIGRKIAEKDWPTQNLDLFKKLIFGACIVKLDSVPYLCRLLHETDLPFSHYYVSKNGYIIEEKRCDWLIGFWDLQRKNLKNA